MEILDIFFVFNEQRIYVTQNTLNITNTFKLNYNYNRISTQ